jgi:Oxygen-sensitive ribonucleoside-triphosphate reductase
MPYIECPECGQRALSVATRCPRCGHNYPQQPIWQQAPGPGLNGLRPLLPMAGVLVAAVIIVVLIGRLVGGQDGHHSELPEPRRSHGPAAPAPKHAGARRHRRRQRPKGRAGGRSIIDGRADGRARTRTRTRTRVARNSALRPDLGQHPGSSGPRRAFRAGAQAG